MGGVPSIPRDRTRSVEIISAGYSRTGTVSMSLALAQLLDGPAFHGGTQLFGREDAYAKLWVDIFRARHDRPKLLRLLREATAGFVAVADSPAIQFLPELLEIYPDAKVVLVERDPARFAASFKMLYNTVGGMGLLKVLLWPCPNWRWMAYWMGPLIEMETVRLSDAKVKLDASLILPIHGDWVRSRVPGHKLLTMDLSEGWSPLAKFLDKPVPDMPFPRSNDSESFKAHVKYIVRTALLAWAGILTGLAAFTWLLMRVMS